MFQVCANFQEVNIGLSSAASGIRLIEDTTSRPNLLFKLLLVYYKLACAQREENIGIEYLKPKKYRQYLSRYFKNIGQSRYFNINQPC